MICKGKGHYEKMCRRRGVKRLKSGDRSKSREKRRSYSRGARSPRRGKEEIKLQRKVEGADLTQSIGYRKKDLNLTLMNLLSADLYPENSVPEEEAQRQEAENQGEKEEGCSG